MRIPPIAEVPGLWIADGSLRDVYVLDTTLDDWRRFVEHAAVYDPEYTFDGESRPLPPVHAIFTNRDGAHLLALQVHGVRVHCHFFVQGEIELDIAPREIRRVEQHEAVLTYVQSLSCWLNKAVLITPENGVETPYLSFQPANGGYWVVGG